MIDYLAYMESVWMRESLLDRRREDYWDGLPARPQHTSRDWLGHRLALALRGFAAHLDPVPA
jgi:hypothetical protein